MGFKRAMFSDVSGTIFEDGEGIEIRIKSPGENDGDAPTHVILDVLPTDELADEKGKAMTIADLIGAGREVKPRGRKPATEAAADAA